MGQTILAQLERLARNWQLKYMKPRQTDEVVETGRILFHPGGCQAKILLAYKKKLKELKLE